MNIIKLKISGNKITLDNNFFEQTGHYLNLLYRSRQIVNKEYQYEPVENGVQLNLYCPEKTSYQNKFSTKYAIAQKESIEKAYHSVFEFNYVGSDPECKETVIPETSEFYILRPAGISPLADGVSFDQIPLYKIPYTDEKYACYSDIHHWESTYEHIEAVWYRGYGADKWTSKQLQNHNSELSIGGINCCKQIEKLTGIPTYYFLFNDRAWGRIKDKKRKCPGCQGEWFIEGSTFNHYYAFKCDNCRLVSQLSSNK